MNERIKELAKQAKAFIVEPEHASVGGVSEVSFDKYSDLAKFAELIVRECASIVYNTCEDGDVGAQAILYEFNIDDARNQK